MKHIKNIYNNRPWKDVKTRKLAFTYCLIMGTIIIIFGAIMIALNRFDTATWMSESLSFSKYMMTTGVVVVLSGSVKEMIALLKDSNNEPPTSSKSEPDEDEGEDDDEV